MSRTITLRLSDEAYETVKRYADHDQQSMNNWLETLLDAEDMRRRCEAHGKWMAANPNLADEALAIYEARQRDMEDAGLGGILDGVA